MSDTKEWTLMFYFASDNPLASTIVSQLKALKDAGHHPDANVIAQFDPHAVNTPVHVFDVNHVSKFWSPDQSEVGFANNNPFIRDLVLDRLWGEKNEEIREVIKNHVEQWKPEGSEFDPPKPSAAMSGEQSPVDALTSFLTFCRESYPARHYMLFILGHGQVVGNDSLLLDEHASERSLTLTQLGQVLRAFGADVQHDNEPGEVELVALHSCSMSAMEVAYELKGAAKYMMASQGPTYVGNLPYKQILIRVFNDLNLELSPEDLNGVHKGKDGKQSFVEKLVKPAEPISEFLHNNLKSANLDRHVPGTAPTPKLISAIVKDLNELPKSDDFAEVFKSLTSGKGKNQSNGANGSRFWDAGNRRRSFRLFLADKYPEIARYPRHSITEMLRKIFFYCLYNSYDFQLAGYPFDLCLTNLSKVSETENAINKLADSLMKGLDDKDSLPKQLIQLAHLDAQSFYQEDYVDLYDFCFCLIKRCKEREKETNSVSTLEPILEACQYMRTVLERGSDNLIFLAAFSGPAFQYSHGLSIYFPWTKPLASKIWDEQYAQYRLNRETRWRTFLEKYFEKTMRLTHDEELRLEDPDRPNVERPITNRLLSLIGRIGTHALFAEGRLQKPGPDHPMGKYGPDDPTGANCNCATIKNYPPFTGVSENFLDGAQREIESMVKP